MMDDNTTALPDAFRSGFVAIVGAPNAGKSTLLNRILREKISITSKKPQTTRNRILGVMHEPGFQMIFIDTPGVHKTKQPFNTRIVEEALTAIGDVDILLMLMDVSQPDPESEKFLVNKLKEQRRPVILALNKIDLLKKDALLSKIGGLSEIFHFEAIIPISAKHGDQVDVLIRKLSEHLPEGPPFFPEDTLTDLPERFIVAEMIREKVFRLTGQEIPYSTAVTIDAFTRKSNRLVKIEATIHVERNSQKGIIIGKKGAKLKKIGEDARYEIERMVDSKVFLKLFVRVEKNWSTDTKAMRRLGYK